MRETPTWRIPFGVLGLLLVLCAYGLLIARYVAPLMSDWHVLLQTPIYLFMGVVWIMPLRRFLIWMETGRWG
ncbi:DUF2842 domain-containing protein [Novosphingobium aerophilum]|uniref:DUF2842 domain-containing protein n=1 Tax=Novosphingobium TaxID=165696 RepID=UPI0006C8AF20|nr:MULTISPECIES: DUF2842 domain-containing protein [unclassified Novosphingobium]KPH66363.1 hypothetical protein ADT71_06775 [Novosphingobium sp. ST904]MPS70540.1 DUF2842 domain-containing protein [Novosphingobium sp.]TCM42053.1 uncharacterized protein DUF2842 [Novosphingobium sp. ST904]WRT91328.1 DUF2842 domain-containing protein [Novosphingobium sp. RL4]